MPIFTQLVYIVTIMQPLRGKALTYFVTAKCP